MVKRILWLLAFLLLAAGTLAEAQQAKKVPRIGYLAVSTASAHSVRIEAFRQGLRDLGYVEGQNIVIEYRYAEANANRLADLAAELVRLKVDAIVTTGTEGALAAKRATTTIPIVTTTGDALAAGVIASLARPGENITGLTNVALDLSGKRLELLKESVPRITRVGVLFTSNDPGAAANFKETEKTARALGLQVQSLEVRSVKEFDAAFKRATEARIHALDVLGAASMNARRTQIVEFAIRSRLPTMFAESAFVEAGGLMFYGPNTPDLYRRAATYVDKILKGSKPADLPVEQPKKFDFIVNLKTAKQIGVTIAPEVLARATKLIK